MLRKAIQALHPGQYGRGTNVAWTTQVNIYHIVYFIRILQYLFDLKCFAQVPVAKLKCKTSLNVAKLAKSASVSPSMFVDWENMEFSKVTGRDFSSGPRKEHLKLGVKWVPLKVFYHSFKGFWFFK